MLIFSYYFFHLNVDLLQQVSWLTTFQIIKVIIPNHLHSEMIALIVFSNTKWSIKFDDIFSSV